jgi:hypothetical protein
MGFGLSSAGLEAGLVQADQALVRLGVDKKTEVIRQAALAKYKRYKRPVDREKRAVRAYGHVYHCTMAKM